MRKVFRIKNVALSVWKQVPDAYTPREESQKVLKRYNLVRGTENAHRDNPHGAGVAIVERKGVRASILNAAAEAIRSGGSARLVFSISETLRPDAPAHYEHPYELVSGEIIFGEGK